MSVDRISLLNLIESEFYVEGSRLYSIGAVLVTSVKQLENRTEVKSFFPKENHGVTMIVTASSFTAECTCGQPMCSHIVATALAFNELELEEELPEKQLEKMVEETGKHKKVSSSVAVSLDEDGFTLLNRDAVPFHISRLLHGTENSVNALVAVSPELFTLNARKLHFGKTAGVLSYSREQGELRFSLPEYIRFFAEDSFLFNTEDNTVILLHPKQKELLATLLRATVQSRSEEGAVHLISLLNRALRPAFTVAGQHDYRTIRLSEEGVWRCRFSFSTPTVMLITTELLLNDDTVVPVMFTRSDKDHAYLVQDTLFVIPPERIKKIKRILRAVGAVLRKGSFTISASLLSVVTAPESPLIEAGVLIETPDMHILRYREEDASHTDITLHVDETGGWFSFSVTLPGMSVPVHPDSLINAIREFRKGVNEPIVSDKDGTVYQLKNSKEFLSRLSQMLSIGNVVPGKKIKQVMLPHLLKKDAHIRFDNTVSEKNRRRYRTAITALRSMNYPTPNETDIVYPKELRNYQKEGVNWILLLFQMGMGGALLADEMGLGKTAQALTVLSTFDRTKPLLIVAPKTLLWTWVHESKKFFPDLTPLVIDSFPPTERSDLWKNAENSVIITSYSILTNDFQLVKRIRFSLLIIDEAQHIKNSATKRFKALKGVQAERRLALTGTPLENRPSELWTLFSFLMPGFPGAKKEIVAAERSGDVAKIQEFSHLVAPFVLRRTKQEIMPELPDLIIRDVPVEMSGIQKDFYLSLLLRSRAEWIESGGGEQLGDMDVLRLLTRLRMVADHPGLLGEKEFSYDDSGKIIAIREIVSDVLDGGGALLIFSQFLGMLSHIKTVLNEMNEPFCFIDGSTKERQKEIDSFNNGEKRVFLLSLKVGGVGLNLTAADNVIITDPWWNPAVEEQAWSRAHRIGQDKNVVVHKLYSINSIEERILAMQEEKKKVVDMFLSQAVKNPEKDFLRKIAAAEFDTHAR